MNRNEFIEMMQEKSSCMSSNDIAASLEQVFDTLSDSEIKDFLEECRLTLEPAAKTKLHNLLQSVSPHPANI
jgi:hypothetical protein